MVKSFYHYILLRTQGIPQECQKHPIPAHPPPSHSIIKKIQENNNSEKKKQNNETKVLKKKVRPRLT